MKQEIVLKHEFVEFIPDDMREGTIYVSFRFATASHLCCCGCGNKIVTPIRPTDWQLIFDGKTISLTPSIGNWSLACQSHYWIIRDRVRWAEHWSQAQIQAGRLQEQAAKERYYGTVEVSPDSGNIGIPESAKARLSIWEKLKRWWVQRKI
jgi:hypothetical protein